MNLATLKTPLTRHNELPTCATTNFGDNLARYASGASSPVLANSPPYQKTRTSRSWPSRNSSATYLGSNNQNLRRIGFCKCVATWRNSYRHDIQPNKRLKRHDTPTATPPRLKCHITPLQ